MHGGSRSEVISAGLIRVFGRDVAELPLVATPKEFRGMVRHSWSLDNSMSVELFLLIYATIPVKGNFVSCKLNCSSALLSD